jgi:hypothetical protein
LSLLAGDHAGLQLLVHWGSAWWEPVGGGTHVFPFNATSRTSAFFNHPLFRQVFLLVGHIVGAEAA